MANTETLETWQPRNPHFVIEQSILTAREEMNSEDTAQLVQELQSEVEHSNGLAYAVLNGGKPQEYSSTDAIVLFDTFSVGASPNRLVKAEFIRRVAEHAGIADDEGKLKPVILLASPGPGSTIKLSAEEKRQVKDGNLGVAAKEMLEVVRRREFGRIGLLGFSQGAALAIEGAQRAHSKDLDVDRLALGDPPTVQERSLAQFGKDFNAHTDFGPVKEASDLDAQKATLNTADAIRAARGFLKSINWALINGMRHSTFGANMEKILAESMVSKAVVGYGTESRITRPAFIEPLLLSLKDVDTQGILTSVKVEGSNHTWGDELPLIAKLYLEALT